ncbi:MAG: hypothetical protein K0S30_1613 [Clostridia bacterium]|nr:hypothetical protein [Clostridia bacterium]
MLLNKGNLNSMLFYIIGIIPIKILIKHNDINLKIILKNINYLKYNMFIK